MINCKKTEIMNIGPNKNYIRELLPHKGFKWKTNSIKMLGVNLRKDKQELFLSNFADQFQSMLSTLKRWSNRRMGLRGKIAIVKSLAISKLVYLTSVLPNPPMQFINEVDKDIFRFIWDDKPDKIKRLIMINDLENGGLRSPHFKSMCEAAKILWVKRLLDSNHGKWKTLLQIELENLGGNLIWNCNFKSTEEGIFGKIRNSFLKDMLTSWSTMFFGAPNSYNEVSCQYLWFNSFIRINNQIVYYKLWAQNKVLQIKDLLNDRGHFLTFQQFIHKFNLRCNFLQYYSIIHAIPTEWKRILKNINVITEKDTCFNVSKLNLSKMSCKMIYFQLVKKIAFLPQNAFKKWSNELDTKAIESEKIFSLLYKCSIEERLRNFQFKLLHRILPTNIFLTRVSKSETPFCYFCQGYKETFIHLFCECAVIKAFWEELAQWLLSKNIILSLQPKCIILGQNLERIDVTLEFVNLTAKYYIYCCKMKETKPTLQNFKHKLLYIEKIEKYISLNRGTLDKHIAKWFFLS